MRRSHGKQVVSGRVYGRFWLGGAGRESVPLPAMKPGDDALIDARCQLIADVTARLVAAGRSDRARDFAVQLGAATSKRDLERFERVADKLVASSGAIGGGETFRKFGERWTSGELAKLYPDHVRVKSTAGDDQKILEKYVYPVVGSTPLRAFELSDAESVMAGVPGHLSSSRRRHVAQAMHRLLRLAVYPAKVIDRSPLPAGFLPKLRGEKAKQFLYPDEDAKLMACTMVPLVYRVFYGLMGREGLRFSEARGLSWAELDLDRGTLRLDENKTEDPRTWALDAGVVAALKAWRASSILAALRGPFGEVDDHHPAERFREHLKLAGVTREELFAETKARHQIHVHDLRATFVTISLANGKSEMWVADRTGHKSTLMIARYRRAARTVSELGLGPLHPLRETIVWEQQDISKNSAVVRGQKRTIQRKVAPPGLEPGCLSAADFKTDLGSSDVAPRAENKPPDDVARRGARPLADNLQVAHADLHAIRRGWSAIEIAAESMSDGAADFGEETS